MLDFKAVKEWNFGEIAHTYGEKDAILYALGVGLGMDPADPLQLPFVQEDGLKALPTMAAVVGSPGHWLRDARTGIDWVKVLHGEQDLTLHAVLPPTATLRVTNRVGSIFDKGLGRGAVCDIIREIFHAETGELVARGRQISLMRGDGGFSGAGPQADTMPEMLPPLDVHGRQADRTLVLLSSTQAALIYRLSGDRNPLHADPKVAKAAGYPQPILHGLSSFGMAGHAVLRSFCDYDVARLRRLAVRFSSPVFPGESLHFDFWQVSSTCVRFRATVAERNAIVLDNGIAELRA